MRLAYVAGPYRADEPWRATMNVASGVLAASELMRLGFAVLSPHSTIYTTIGYQSHNDDDSFIDAMCEEWVKRCDLVVTYCDYSHSEGTKAEVALAHSLGIPVLTMEEVRAGAAG